MDGQTKVIISSNIETHGVKVLSTFWDIVFDMGSVFTWL